LSAPYADPQTNREVEYHLPSGYRSCGMVEITLDDGTKGLGEGYIPVFAPRVFVEIVELIAPYMIGRDVMDMNKNIKALTQITGYWSLQGAARHVVSAYEIALQDCRARVLGLPLYKVLGGSIHNPIKLYGSGGDSDSPEAMEQEMQYLKEKGIDIFKIRARNHEPNKTAWCLNKGNEYDISIAVDMAQNLSVPAQSITDVLSFLERVYHATGQSIYFLEEVLGPNDISSYPLLRQQVKSKIAGGEIVTTQEEIIDRIIEKYYDIAQPDATVIGGVSSVMEVLAAGRQHGTEVVVHCWAGPVGMMANYHAAIAGGSTLAEWPMPAYPLRDELVVEPWNIHKGALYISDAPGLGVELTEAIEKKYAFRDDAVYTCFPTKSYSNFNDEIWK